MEKIVSKNLITAIPGIGTKYAQRLHAVGIKTPGDLLNQYKRLDKDPHRFMHWMKKQCQANAGHAKKTFDGVNGLTFDANPKLPNRDHKADEMKHKTADGRKKFNISTSKSLLKSAKVHNAVLNAKIIASDGQIQPSNNSRTDLQGSTIPLAASGMKMNDQNVDSATKKAVTNHESSNEDNNGAKDALNQHLSKLREQFSDMHDSANQKVLALQSELGRMQHMSHEFDVLAEFLTSEEKLSIFEQNLDRLQRTVRMTEDKIHEINTNNQKMGRMIREINETAKKQHENNERAIVTFGERLERWELKLDRVTRKITNRKIDSNDFQLNKFGDLGQLKDDIENVLNSRLAEVSTDMENMKNVVICIIALVVLKMFVFDFFKDDLRDKLAATKE